jgi:ribonuclease HI
MELMAIGEAVKAADEGCTLSILSDCIGVIYALGFDKYGNAKQVKDTCSNLVEAQLRDEVRRAIKERGITVRWIKGHKVRGIHRQADVRARGLLRSQVAHATEIGEACA